MSLGPKPEPPDRALHQPQTLALAEEKGRERERHEGDR